MSRTETPFISLAMSLAVKPLNVSTKPGAPLGCRPLPRSESVSPAPLRPRFPDQLRRRVSALALSVINDVITREAFRHQLTLIDLRVMFAKDADFANPIEPSVQGGMKFARAIHHFVSDRPQVVI